jgi:hypothetical protein
MFHVIRKKMRTGGVFACQYYIVKFTKTTAIKVAALFFVCL